MDMAKMAISGVIIIGLVTAFGLHSTGLAKLVPAAGRASSGVLNTAERG